MVLNNLSVLNFKSYEEADLQFSDRVNCFVGNNGEGKTNLLDAIYYLSFCKSYFNPIDSQNIRFDADFFMIKGAFGEQPQTVQVSVKRRQKKQVRLNKKEYDRLADHIGRFPVVMITPYDAQLVHEGSEVRRKLLDSMISQFNRRYLDHLVQYNKVLQQRNALLKRFAETRKFERDMLEIFNHQLIEHAVPLHHHRKEMMEALTPLFQEAYAEISGGREEVRLEHRSQLYNMNMEVLLADAEHKDRVMTHTTVGPHKDDMVFKIGDHPLKRFGSQGQQKSFLIALKMAQFEMLRQRTDKTPILLLDDIFDKLDALRVKQLMNRVSGEQFGQIFVTDTHAERLSDMLTEIGVDHKMFTIKNGTASA